MGRKRAISNRWRATAALLLLAILAGGWLWWRSLGWTPGRSEWPVQGVEIGAADVVTLGAAANFVALKAIGADFAYIDASIGAEGRDPAFVANLAAARAVGMRFGAVHVFDPCVPAERQAANFFTVVPRDPEMLPAAIELDMTADGCDATIGDAAVESELATFLNQVEGHTGKPALLKISEDFEERYGLAARIERDLWLERDWFEPSYAGRPWTLWTANSALRSDASDRPLRWVVAQP